MNWKNIIHSLLSDGWTQTQIAKAVGVAQPTISGLLSGAQRDMRWESGNRLISLYRLNCKPLQESELDVGPFNFEEPHMPTPPSPNLTTVSLLVPLTALRKGAHMLKTLYARLVLLLIQPALEVRELELAERAQRRGDDVRNRINTALKDRGSALSRSMRSRAHRECS